jgi:hypothetical protein
MSKVLMQTHDLGPSDGYLRATGMIERIAGLTAQPQTVLLGSSPQRM